MIKVYGCSDDLVEIEAGDKSDELRAGEDLDEPPLDVRRLEEGALQLVALGCYAKPVQIEITDAIGQGVRLVVRYEAGGKAVWGIEVSPLDEDIPIPWPVRIKLGGRGYSACAEIDADPAQVTIERRATSREDG